MTQPLWILTMALAALVLISVVLVVYHHALYPMILRAATRRGRQRFQDVMVRRWCPTPTDANLPTIAILTPAYNEAAVIADKVRNAAALDYPADRLRLVLVCDGATDGTAQIARAASLEPECAHLRVDIIESPDNVGKVARINDCVPMLDADIVALSDASALISIDALLIAADHFSHPGIGAVCATYRLMAPESAGEAMYWEYQTRIKECEAQLGSSIGAHGACYFFRRDLFRPLPADTINDDFILPMMIVTAGYRSIYDSRMIAVEIATAKPGQDYQRRKRIAAGNVQQVLRLKELLNPQYGATAFVFASGKALRSVIPFLLVLTFVISLLLATVSPLFAILSLTQIACYATAFMADVYPAHRLPRPIITLQYFVRGHLAGLIGASRYVLGLERTTWRNATVSSNAELRTVHRFNEYLIRLGVATTSAPAGVYRPSSPALMAHIHPIVHVGKRAFDLAFSALLLALAAPLFPLIALLIKIDTQGPVFFFQLRIGESRLDYTRLFHVIKFRSMRTDAECGTGAVWATEGDPRITRVGRFLRRTRLDELPQLINVLRGEMSLIGPRPERPGFFASLDRQIPYYRERIYGIKPGMTGFSQVVNCADETIDDVRVKLYYDHAYALALSQPAAWLSLDCWIFVRTMKLIMVGSRILKQKQPPCIYIVNAAGGGSNVGLLAGPSFEGARHGRN